MEIFYTRAVPEVQGDEILKFGSEKYGGFWVANSQFSPGKIGLKFVTENFTTFFTRARKINANFFCTKFFDNPSGHGRPR